MKWTLNLGQEKLRCVALSLFLFQNYFSSWMCAQAILLVSCTRRFRHYCNQQVFQPKRTRSLLLSYVALCYFKEDDTKTFTLDGDIVDGVTNAPPIQTDHTFEANLLITVDNLKIGLSIFIVDVEICISFEPSL